MNKIKKHRKIGIITLNGYNNYGNRLQAYATQKIIKNLGFDVDIIITKDTLPYEKNKIKKEIKKIYNNFAIIIDQIKGSPPLYKHIRRKGKDEREKPFIIFSKKYLSEAFYDDEKNLNKISDNYDFFIAGSDQVWNPNYINNKKASIYFLTFAPRDKRIAYAASFGISNIPAKYMNDYKKWLSGIKNISVRENAGAKIINNLIGITPPVLIDPTLMLSKKEWLSISKIHVNKPRENYLLTYFVGGMDDKIKTKIKKISLDYNLKIIKLADLGDKKRIKTDPSEFIDYINSAKMFLTDSFHGVIFSIIMETPFIVLERNDQANSMFSRIDTLLKKFKLEGRKIEKINSNDKIFDIDFSHTQPILEYEQNKAINFLKKSLNIAKN
jgi:exopolysaccharide biosynthesis predicted pyruvyltransferase EpsI